MCGLQWGSLYQAADLLRKSCAFGCNRNLGQWICNSQLTSQAALPLFKKYEVLRNRKRNEQAAFGQDCREKQMLLVCEGL